MWVRFFFRRFWGKKVIGGLVNLEVEFFEMVRSIFFDG